jgi:hypothetical protein
VSRSTLSAEGTGSKLNFSTITTFNGGGSWNTEVTGSSGGTVDLSKVPSLTSGAYDIRAIGAGGIVKLNAVTNFSPTNFSDTNRILVQDGGSIELPNLTTIGERVSVVVNGASSLNLPALTAANKVNFGVLNGATFTMPAAVTSYTGNTATRSTLSADGTGSKLDMSSITTFNGGNSWNTEVTASNGGTVDLSKVPSLTSGAYDIRAFGAGSVTKLNAVTNFSPTNFSDTNRLWAADGGTIEVPNLTTLGDRAQVVVSGASTMSLPALTSANKASFFALNGAVFIFTAKF